MSVCSIFLIFSIVIFPLNISYGFISKRSGNIELFDEIESSARVDKNKPVVLYDNIHYRHGEKTDGCPVFSKGCSCLIPADIINVNLNMTYLFHSPVKPAKDMLGELIYANIELRKMLEQYNAVQKQAVKIAQVSGASAYIDSPYSIYMPMPEIVIRTETGQKIHQALKHDRDQSYGTLPEKKNTSVVFNIKRTENCINRVMNITRPVAAAKPLDKNGMEDVGAVVDVSPLTLAGNAPEKFINIAANRSYNFQQLKPVSSGGAPHSSGDTSHMDTRRERGGRTPADVTPEELPWWIRAPLEMITYCMNNKLEAGLLLLVVIFFMNIIGGIFRR